MAESSNSAAASGQTQTAAKPTKAPNPVWKMMGMPNFRLKLPSRNWMIFLTVTGSFTAALVYDRKQKKRAQQKWCDLVAHLSKESLPVDQTRRKLTVFLSAPPGDGLRVAREHFKEYVKPILVAAALDYQVIEGRREGDIRAGLAERIRKFRRKSGEPSTVVEETGIEEVVADAREKIGVVEEPVPKGDLIIGRSTWKEYIRGLHEGWLGPLDPPQPPVTTDVPSPSEGAETNGSPDETPTTENSEKKEEPEKKDEKPSKPTGPTPAYITPADYSSQSLPRSLPQSLDGSVPIQFPHILGFLNTPIRIYRYLNQRYLADSVGREVAGIVLASATRPYNDGSFSTDSELTPAGVDGAPASDNLLGGNYEQQTLLEEEEKDWHKSAHKKDEANPDKEREWVDSVVLDPRIAARMQRYVLSPEDEARSQRIAEGAEYILGEERPTPVPFWQRMWIKYGYGEDEETLKRKPIIGNIDGEDDQ
ncbi:mitochondrial import inner membrane translocase subunit Tim54 [Aspergillus novoparasiticus]|uniref:Mitochondrial import inner membrane translocase subunit TIM54 n=1 Tax=Aspergillus novoparasiticus TaxID=986946 RepID=A0A5N6EQW7_9EURO|nr:mitochondrial import inner membrane translocase subunit Tim54 [Aspergillus novoparasiticus]